MPDHGLVQCKHPFSMVLASGARIVISSGDIYWATDHVVKGHEDFFTDVNVKSSASGARSNTLTLTTGNSVETASAAPGSRRKLSKVPAETPVEAEKSEV